MKKIYFGVFLVFFLGITSYFFSSEYTYFVSQNFLFQSSQDQANKAKSLFSFANIREIPGTEIDFTPDKKYLDIIEKNISLAQERIYINVYILTEKKIRNVLLQKQKEGLDIKILLEKNVYNSYAINDLAFNILSEAGIDMKWSSNDNYDLNHAKYIIVDDKIIISTGNLTASTFSKNRDIFLTLSDTSILKTMETIFLHDFEGKYSPLYHDSLVISPTDSRQKITYLLENAQSLIQMYVPYMDDEPIADLILQRLSEGVKVEIVTGKNDMKDDFFKKVVDLGGKVTFSKKSIHAKSILIDGTYVFIGSQNFSTPSLDSNKEIGVLLRGNSLIEKWKKVFGFDL